MSLMPTTKPSWVSSVLWSNSIALSWMWGLGLFYSVQFTIERGWGATLLWFALPNALGLLLFGAVTQRIAARENATESLAHFFTKWSRQFRFAFGAYQFIALALTLFVVARYIILPLAPEPLWLWVTLVMVMVLAVTCWLGEEFEIGRIKKSHAVMGGLILLAMVLIGMEMGKTPVQRVPESLLPIQSWGDLAFLTPLFVGLLVGPWLDLQQWQRAIQMQREGVSIRNAYALGALLFFGLLAFHAIFTWWALGQGTNDLLRLGVGDYLYGHEIGVLIAANSSSFLLVAYLIFLGLCLISTLDSGYIATRWFLREMVAEWKSPIMALLPAKALSSPIPWLVLAAVVGVGCALLSFELEYFMIFYGTFFIGYAVLGLALCRPKQPLDGVLPGVPLFCLGLTALGLGGFGYFLREPWLMVLAALLPFTALGYLRKKSEAVATTEVAVEVETPAEVVTPESAPLQPMVTTSTGVGSHDLRGHFEGKWFVTSFMTTYADTNSVGNVYFGMYAMWAGKARELFFNQVMPDFNIETSSFYILTRTFEHKFVRETREFHEVSVRLRIGSYNRKFVMLEHEIHDAQLGLLGKGKQTLMFVTAKNYKLIDLPPEIFTAFIAYA
jgi:acyl-CoA thioesterase FadM